MSKRGAHERIEQYTPWYTEFGLTRAGHTHKHTTITTWVNSIKDSRPGQVEILVENEQNQGVARQLLEEVHHRVGRRLELRLGLAQDGLARLK